MEYTQNNEATAAALPVQREARDEARQGFSSPFSERRLLLVGVDVLVVFLMVQVAFATWRALDHERFDSQPAVMWLWFPALLAIWLGLASLNDLYDVPSSTNLLQSAGRVGIASGLAFLIYLFIFFVAPRETLPRVFVVSFLVANGLGMLIWRYTYASWFSRQPMQYRVLIVGDGAMANTMADVLRHSSHVNYAVLGHIRASSAPEQLLERELGAPMPAPARPAALLAEPDELGYLVNRLRVHEVVVAVEEPLDKETFQQLIECQAWGVKVSYMPDLYEKLKYSIPVQHIDPAWALHVIQDRPVFDRVQLALKRALDLALATIGLIGLALLLPIVALAIKLTSPGPIFYRQTRCGRAGQPFKILKFRTMSDDAERDGKARWAHRGDSRITLVGRILRKTRIDELPQLINVLRGEMSFVGPRPERPEFVTELQHQVPFYYTRLMVKPGITGWAQIHYDYGNTVEDALIKLQYDFYYLRYWSIWLDLYTIFQTFKVVFQFKGI